MWEQARHVSALSRSATALEAPAPDPGAGVLDVCFEDIRLGEIVGRSAYGEVFAGYLNGTEVAVKRLDDLSELERTEGPEAAQALVMALKEEARLVATFDHPNVVRFMGLCTSPPAIITEFCAQGSLMDVLRKAKGTKVSLPWARRLRMAEEAAQGMHYLHSREVPVIHGNLQSPNLLVDEDWHVKVAGFGLSKMATLGYGTMDDVNPRWLSPEVLDGSKASVASDIFAFGVVLWELMTWEIPYAKEHSYRIVLNVMEGGRLEVPPASELPGGGFRTLSRYVALMTACWEQEPAKRPTSFAEVLAKLKKLKASYGPLPRAAGSAIMLLTGRSTFDFRGRVGRILSRAKGMFMRNKSGPVKPSICRSTPTQALRSTIYPQPGPCTGTLAFAASCSSRRLKGRPMAGMAASGMATTASGMATMTSELTMAYGRREIREIYFTDIRMGEIIGRGAFAKVFEGYLDEVKVAVKRLEDLSELRRTEGPEAVRDLLAAHKEEAGLMAALRHPNVVGFKGMCNPPPALVIEFCARGSLMDVLRAAKRDPGSMPWSLRLRMAREAAQGMHYLHRQYPPIIHRDLKSLNLLVDEDWHVKIADFGLSRMANDSGNLGSGTTMDNVNPRWLSPEVLDGCKASVASDIFAFGMVMWELMTWEAPYARERSYRVMVKVMEGGRPEVPPVSELPGGGFDGLPDYLALMRACWEQEPAKRPRSFAEVVVILAMLEGLPPTNGVDLYPVINKNGQILEAIDCWNIRFEDISLGEMIGKGSFGKVFAGYFNETKVAVRRLDDLSELMRTEGSEASAALLAALRLGRLKAEAGIMAALRHPNIVSFMGMCTSPPAIVTEFCARGSLADVLKAAKDDPGSLPWAMRLRMARDAAQGMLYLHCQRPPVIHRDLKSPNLLVDGDWHIKIADFCLSRIANETGFLGSGNTMDYVNPGWLSPEVLKGAKASVASDVFAFGVVLWELMNWEIPFANEPGYRVFGLVTEGGRLEVPPASELPGGGFDDLPEYVALMKACWEQDPAKRPSFGKIIAELRKLKP